MKANPALQRTAANHIRIRHLIFVAAVLVFALAFVGCGKSGKAQSELTEKVRQTAAEILKKDVSQIDVRKPLGIQGADELDTVEIVMTVEETFKVEIPDSAIGEKPNEIAKTLTVQKLADVVARQMEKQKR